MKSFSSFGFSLTFSNAFCRCSQDLQNLDSKDKYYSCEDKLLIQPSKKIKQMRDELAKQKGKSYIQGKQPVYNPDTQTYEYR